MEEILDQLTISELFAIHAKLAADIAATRKTQGVIDAVIQRKERMSEQRGDPRLTQSIEPAVKLG